jgi:quaternary ammonium compound-resistance protein SugE
MAWTYLFVAGLLEIVWAVGLKYSGGFTKLWPSVGTASAMIASFFFLSMALKTLPLGTAYAVWTGIGAVGTAVIGLIFFGESRETLRVICILLIVAGITGLKLTSPK